MNIILIIIGLKKKNLPVIQSSSLNLIKSKKKKKII